MNLLGFSVTKFGKPVLNVSLINIILSIKLTQMKLREEELSGLLAELERLEVRVRAKIKQLKDDMGMSRKYKLRIHQGRLIEGEIQGAIREIQESKWENALDRVWALTKIGLKIKSIQFPPDYKSFRELRKESIRKNPEHLIKRSKSHGGGYRS